MDNVKYLSRRFFLQGCAALGTMGLSSAIGNLRLINAAAAQGSYSDYRALVCIFLYGGNDSINLLVPTSEPEYSVYAQDRQNLAIPKAELLSIGTLAGDGRSFGMPPETSALHALYSGGGSPLAFVANVGTMAEPITKESYLNRSAKRPPQLYSHNDQQFQWQTGVPDSLDRSGWGGRLADMVYAQNANTQLSMSISLAGFNTFQVGDVVSQYHLTSNGSPAGLSLPGPSDRRSQLEAAIQNIAGNSDHLLGQAYGDLKRRALDNYVMLAEALANTPAPLTPFPSSNQGNQLRTVAHMINAAPSLGLHRQIFFCSMGGYDTHDNQEVRHPQLLSDLSASIAAFYSATVELGVSQQVTTFTASDFGRTFNSNGKGSDHGWGGHQMVVGDSVRGGQVYGQVPVLAMEGPDVVGRAFVPTIAVDEFAATLASWFGADPYAILPNLNRFDRDNLGFMV